MDKSKPNKATWDPAAHRIFLEICKEEVLARNRPTHCLNNQGYNNLIAKFKARTNRTYTRKQFKNRWDSLKKDWTMWKTLNQHASGLGRDPVSGTIAASGSWWEQQIEVQPECAKFRLAPLEHEDDMRIIFEDITCTNASAVVPGATPSHGIGIAHVNLEEDDLDSDCDIDECTEGTPTMRKKRKKRVAKYSPAPMQPSKKKEKSEKELQINRILELVEKETSKTSKNSSTSVESSGDPVRKEIKEMLALVIEAGAEEGIDEHFYATQLLMKKSYHDMFINLTTPHGRLAWLRRTWEEKNKR